MLFNKEKIKEALEYYDIKDADYQEKCDRCIEKIKNNKKILDGYNRLVYTNHCKEVR